MKTHQARPIVHSEDAVQSRGFHRNVHHHHRIALDRKFGHTWKLTTKHRYKDLFIIWLSREICRTGEEGKVLFRTNGVWLRGMKNRRFPLCRDVRVSELVFAHSTYRYNLAISFLNCVSDFFVIQNYTG
ncbi:calmodulin-domain protein kinase 5 [Striga asiatica]|uniref:Calmodulin-domain protein kinase 5 n=1 Tax=Striga asiatica TaxID=4170 RepID=A0A5A7NY81_STRAF|nr:calmodulin-domain protein kinase 5 [Striga asiatica]